MVNTQIKTDRMDQRTAETEILSKHRRDKAKKKKTEFQNKRLVMKKKNT